MVKKDDNLQVARLYFILRWWWKQNDLKPAWSGLFKCGQHSNAQATGVEEERAEKAPCHWCVQNVSDSFWPPPFFQLSDCRLRICSTSSPRIGFERDFNCDILKEVKYNLEAEASLTCNEDVLTRLSWTLSLRNPEWISWDRRIHSLTLLGSLFWTMQKEKLLEEYIERLNAKPWNYSWFF